MSEFDAWDVKARRIGLGASKFNADLHPRDRKGRFIETGAEVRIWGGGRGTVIKNVGGGRIEVRMLDKKGRPTDRVELIHRNYLTVEKRPDGSKPTSKAADNPKPLKAEAPTAGSRNFTPSTPDGRTPVKDLKGGQAVIVYGRTGQGDDQDVRQHVGMVRWVKPTDDGGWTVRLAGVDEIATPVDVEIDDRDAVARVLPTGKMAELTAAIRDGKPEATQLARALLADAVAEDDREADWQGLTPDAEWDEWAATLNDQFGADTSGEDLRRAYESTVGDKRVRQAATANNDVENFGYVFDEALQDHIAEEADLRGGLAQAFFAHDKRFHETFTRAARDRAYQEIRGGGSGGRAERPAPAAKTPAAPQTVVPGDLERDDRVTFDIPVTAANVERFAGAGAKNPPKPGATVTVRGVVEGVETDMFGGSRVHLRRDGAQWQSTGGGGRLDGDGLEWPLDEDHAVHKTGKAEAPQQTRRGGGSVQTAPQGGLFSDVGREAAGTEDMFTAHERDQEQTGGKISGRSDKPLLPNRWGEASAQAGGIVYHEDGQIGRAVRAMGDDGRLDVDGEPLANVLGLLATDAVAGRISSQELLDRVKALRDRLPEGGRARAALDRAVAAMDAPDRPAPNLPDGVPQPLRDLAADLHKVPAVRRDPDMELSQLNDIAARWADGGLSSMRLIREVRAIGNRRHESVEGKTEIDRAVARAVDGLEELRRSDPEALRPGRGRDDQDAGRRDAVPGRDEQGRQPAEVAQPEDAPAPGTAAAAAGGEERAKELHGQAKEAFDAGDYSRALELYDDAVAAWPDAPPAVKKRFAENRAVIEKRMLRNADDATLTELAKQRIGDDYRVERVTYRADQLERGDRVEFRSGRIVTEGVVLRAEKTGRGRTARVRIDYIDHNGQRGSESRVGNGNVTRLVLNESRAEANFQVTGYTFDHDGRNRINAAGAAFEAALAGDDPDAVQRALDELTAATDEGVRNVNPSSSYRRDADNERRRINGAAAAAHERWQQEHNSSHGDATPDVGGRGGEDEQRPVPGRTQDVEQEQRAAPTAPPAPRAQERVQDDAQHDSGDGSQGEGGLTFTPAKRQVPMTDASRRRIDGGAGQARDVIEVRRPGDPAHGDKPLGDVWEHKPRPTRYSPNPQRGWRWSTPDHGTEQRVYPSREAAVAALLEAVDDADRPYPTRPQHVVRQGDVIIDESGGVKRLITVDRVERRRGGGWLFHGRDRDGQDRTVERSESQPEMQVVVGDRPEVPVRDLEMLGLISGVWIVPDGQTKPAQVMGVVMTPQEVTARIRHLDGREEDLTLPMGRTVRQGFPSDVADVWQEQQAERLAAAANAPGDRVAAGDLMPGDVVDTGDGPAIVARILLPRGDSLLVDALGADGTRHALSFSVSSQVTRRRVPGAEPRKRDTTPQIDTNRDDHATLRSTIGAPKTGPAPDEERGNDEPVRRDRDEALEDVQATGVRGTGRPGDVLPEAGRAGERADRGPGRGPGREAAGRRDVPGEDRAAGGREAAGPRESDGRRGVPDARTRPGGRGASGGVADAGGRFRPASQADLAPSGEKAKARANIAAVRTLRTLQAENRPAPDEEKKVLARWSGWGSLPVVFESKPTRAQFRDDSGQVDEQAFARRLKRWESFASERDELRSMLSDREWNEAKRNTLNAHYTDASLVGAIWDAVQKLGFNGGNVLEPGSGSGTFIGMAPERAHMTGVELESTTAAISQALYPDAEIRNESFADTRIPDDSFDAVVGNVPFGDYPLHDRTHNKGQHSIHNHFIIKSLALAKPGGLVAVVTSRYTMDSEDSRARREMAKMGDLVGAVRLPEGAHRAAAGTDVVTDVLVFRKRAEGEEPGDMGWVDAPLTEVNGSQHPINQYFINHPKQVLGEMTTGRGQFTDHDLTVKGDRDAGPALAAALDRVVASAEETGQTYTPSEDGLGDRIVIAAGRQRHDGALAIHPDGSFTQVLNGRAYPLEVHPDHRDQLAALVGLRDAARTLLEEEASTSDDTPYLAELRAELNRRYREYTGRWGAVSKRANKRFTPAEAKAAADAEGRKAGDDDMLPTAVGHAWDDPAMAIVFALDDYDPDTKRTRQAEILHKRVTAARSTVTRVDDPADALAIVMDRTGGLVDLAQIADLLGVDEDEARRQLGDRVYEVPATDRDLPSAGVLTSTRLVSAAEYLSGNVRKKLAAARTAAEEDPRFARNVAALEAVVPRDLTSGEIDAKMGASWIPASIIEQFLNEIVTPGHTVVHPGGSTWVVEGPGKESDAASVEWGTEQRPAAAIAEALLKQQTIRVTSTVKLAGGGKKSYPDPEATIAAQQKAQEMADRFSEWIWEDEARAERLTREYNDRFNSYVLRSYDGVKPALPGLADGWTPRDHQNSAVTRILNEPAVLLAHEVGAGKTAEMVMGAMELRRTGMAKKPAIVVPNHMLEQFTREFLECYPNAKILAAGTKDLEKDKRRRFVARAATGDWDCVILTQKAFEKIDMTAESQKAYMEEELAQLRAQMERAKEAGEDSRAFKQLEKQLMRAEERLKAKLDARRDEGNIYWEHTGIDYLMVDEAHMFKNLRTPSRIEGANIAGSTRASDLHMKLHYLRSKSESGRVVTLATGTPIANSVTEAYTMMRYLRPDLLEEAGIEDFDTWAATFGNVVTDVEMNPDGNGFRMKARFSKFQNVPELLRMYRVSADVKTAADLHLPTPPVRKDANGKRGETKVIPADDAQLEYIQELGVRAEAVRAKRPWEWVNDPVRGIKGMPRAQYEEIYGEIPDPPEDPADRDPNAPRVIEDNMLKISGDGKRAALDMRLIDPNAGGEGRKIGAAADQIAEIYAETKDRVYPASKDDPTPHPTPGALQIVFMDQGTPKAKSSKKKAAAAAPDEDAPAIVGDGDQSDWAAYDEMKAQLVARGIPENMIRYIHEASTDAQKAKLFDDARNGKIAVLLGSTEKMGTGTNVQARAVALHHMDVPWRPADLAQREGRVERQGNLNRGINAEGVYDHDLFRSKDPNAPFGEVRVLRYVTEGTFDGYSWQTIERKARFIAQMQKGNLDSREMEDIGDSALSAAEVKALAAGNPYLLDKAKADADAQRLERLQRAHGRTQAGLASKVERLGREIQIHRENIDEWREAIAARTDTRGDLFEMRFEGQDEPISKRTDAYAPILKAVTEMRDGPYRDGDRVQVGTLGGHPVYATRTRVRRGDSWFRGVQVGFDWPGGSQSYISSEITEGSERGMLASLERRLEGLDSLIDGAEASIRTKTEQQANAQAMIGRPFSHEAQLRDAQARAKLLDDILKTQAVLDELKDEAKKPETERSETYQTAQAELVVLKASLDVARQQVVPDPAAEPDLDITPVLDDPTPTVRTDEDGFAVPDLSDPEDTPSADAPDVPEADAGAGADGPPLPAGVKETDRDLLTALIEEEAGAYTWTGSPSRYVAELFAQQSGTADHPGDSDPEVQQWIEDYLAAHPEALTRSGAAREQLKRQRREREEHAREQAVAIRSQASGRFKAGDYEGALRLIDQAERLSPRTDNWDRIRGIIRDKQQEERGNTTPDAPDAPGAGDAPSAANAPGEADTPGTPAAAAAEEVERPTEAVEPEDLAPGDRIRLVRTSGDVRRVRTRVGGSYLTQRDGRVWEGTIPGTYRPGEPVRLDDVVEYEGDRPGRHITEPGPVRLTDTVERLGTADAATSQEEAARLRQEGEQARRTNQDEAAQQRRTILEEEGGPELLDAVTRFDDLADAVMAGDAPVQDLEDAWLRADAGLAAAKESATHWTREAQLDTMRTNLMVKLTQAGGRSGDARRRAAEWEEAKREAARHAEDGIPEDAPVETVAPGDRVDSPSGEETVTVEEVTRAGDLTFTTERDSEDRRTIRARKDGETVVKRRGGRKPAEVGPATAGEIVAGEWLVDDDGTAVKVVGVERDGDRIIFDVLGPAGPSLVEADAGEAVTRGRNLRMKRPRAPRPPRERKPRSTITALEDGTPATRVRLRSDIRKRVLGLAIEDDETASAEAREAAARLRASQPVSAEQMRALGEHLRGLAGEDLPAVQRRALERAASWVDASYARLAGYPTPPHEPHRDRVEKAYPENLTAGDVVVIPDQAGGQARAVRVVDAKPTPRLPFVQVTVEHGDGRREQRILAAGVDVYLMPDLPEDAPVEPPVQRRREHIVPGALEPGDTIHVGGTDRTITALRKTSPPLAAVEEWTATTDDGQTLTLTSRGFPSVLRVGRGELSAGQVWNNVVDDTTGRPVTPKQVKLGDRISVDEAHGGVTGTVEEIAPLTDQQGKRIGTTAVVRNYSDLLVTVAMLDGDDTLQVTRHAEGRDNEHLFQARYQAKRRQKERVRAVRQALGEAELDLYRSASAAITNELSMRRVAPPDTGDRAWLRAPDLVEKAWKRLDDQAPAMQAARALAGGDEQHAALLAEQLAPLVAQIRERAAENLVQSILEVDPLPGETHDQALKRMLEQFRTDPPLAVDYGLAYRLHVAGLVEQDDPAPEAIPSPTGEGLAERLAVYRKALPANLAELGHRQVTRTVYKPLDLSALEDAYDPETEKITATVPDVADDDGPGEHAMRHLEVIKAAGAEVDRELSARLDTPAYRDAVAAADKAQVAMQEAERVRAEAEAAALQEARTNTLSAVSTATQKAFERAEKDVAKARKAHEAAKARVGELRREAALTVLGEVRPFGGARLTYLTKSGQARKENHKPVQAMRRVEDVYPADWVAMLDDHGPVRLAIAQPNLMGGSGRAGYSNSAHTVVMPDVNVDEQFRQGVHELGHAFQHRLPGLKEAERAFLWERTSTGSVGHRERPELKQVGANFREVGYDGGFPAAYSGRVYEAGNGEIFTTGMESLMAGSNYLDDDMRAWLLGVLAMLGTGLGGPGKDPLDGVDLDELSVDELQALLGRVEWNSPAYERIMAQLRGRRLDNDPLEGVDLEALTPEDLADLLGSLDDNYSAARISEALDRFDAEEQSDRERNARIDELVASGELDYEEAWAQVHGVTVEQIEADRRREAVDDRLAGESVERRVRRQYDEWVETQFWQAEAATNGYMVNARGRAAGVDPKSLFSGDWRRVNAYASDELYNWFRANGWRNYTEYVADVLGRDRDVRAARRSREGRRFTR
ncbi:hypothetical protein GCM10027187_39960 [Streptosporangium sandarakinum]|uniref:N12 class adenine-specific DNA methylase n=1 Tax=Streptosporangium sandarakinum TaxID=1260955 RepID=A0A852V4L7_9ACTN|nr:SNF2-related protein [Streptosporangium sandarakinum]NYF44672.1 N12 class adenine-specific DNA methylase [Streptosporangium sandarakinum]